MKIERGVSHAQKLPPTPPAWGETRFVGKPLPRIDAYERVSGNAVYTVDVTLPGLLHAAILRCPHAHALVKRVDIGKAKTMPGVEAILTGANPEAQIIVPYPNWITDAPPMRLFDPHCRHAGEEVAAVAAETSFQAWDAARAIAVEYEELPFVLNAEEAVEPGAPAVHEGGNAAGQPSILQRGDVTRGFAEADVVMEETYRTPCAIHATMETLCSVAHWDGGRLTVWETSQTVFDQQQSLADALNLPLSSVRVICHYMGGGFGSKAELGKHTLIAALLARKTARPVKVVLGREESFGVAGNRPPCTIRIKAGVKKDGALSALQLTNLGAVGAYRDDGLVGFTVSELYLCPNVQVRETEVYINAGKARAMRAPGAPQCAWALEQMMDALAEKISMDPIELRCRNLPSFSQTRNGLPYTSAGLGRCLREGAKLFGWEESRGRARREGTLLRGVGVAAGMWPVAGGPPATVILRLVDDGSLNLSVGVSEIGTGATTILAMVAAEELSIPLDRIRMEYADTATTPYAQVTGGSRTTINNTPAVREAAIEVRRQLFEIAAAELECSSGELMLRDGRVIPVNNPDRAVPLAQLKGLKRRKEIVAIGSRYPNPPGKIGNPFCAQFAEVEVNARTGEVKVVRLLAAHDSGRVMNRLTYENQVCGGVTMGIGYALTEQRRMDRQTGTVLNANLCDYKVPTAMDVPHEVTCLPVDLHDAECNSTGTKGLGEPATIPTAAAIANAVYHATAVRLTEGPISTMQMIHLLTATRKRG